MEAKEAIDFYKKKVVHKKTGEICTVIEVGMDRLMGMSFLVKEIGGGKIPLSIKAFAGVSGNVKGYSQKGFPVFQEILSDINTGKFLIIED